MVVVSEPCRPLSQLVERHRRRVHGRDQGVPGRSLQPLQMCDTPHPPLSSTPFSRAHTHMPHVLYTSGPFICMPARALTLRSCAEQTITTYRL